MGRRVLRAALVAGLACLMWPGRPGSLARGPTRADGDDPALSGVSWAARALGRARGPSRRRSDDPWVADFAEVVAVGLDAGLDLPAAALASARSPGVLARAPWLHDSCTRPSMPAEG